ncbi:arsenical pump-driving ATPase [Anaerobacillus alkalidiazotrophicus]|uniref:Arsenical pump-driving ATPase n=2 Tax=Anaerobacillus alkalidiazotrophicus TaxID=472963 RepID=A0A1S2M5L2_9BACI|nr:arsenical pump-driving ATPase [Anaerobacillus alkalidiazotrophicus]OIJ18417.1 arsenical pump-driving ATPase [Anaerobacillus alkalidiazotrophicus]OIJ19896.1 arsenical pump-driving ATPase [Anaerobacillus alkalidiazotrophicus]
MELFHPMKLPETRHFFFTGKGGVGKTSTACATAVALAQAGRKVLIVSTDPASNLEDVFDETLSNTPKAISEVPNLFASNLDPEEAAKQYRESVIGPYRGKLPKAALDNMEEQLSGACTVEIAAFDEFTNLLSNDDLTKQFDHVIFDTAPTGHTLRLLQLPTAWSDFLEENTTGTSCLGPLSGLASKKDLYARTVTALSNREETTLILVSRPEYSSLSEAERAATELSELGIKNQALIINGVFHVLDRNDHVANQFERKQLTALEQMSDYLKSLTTFQLPLVPFNLTGIEALKKLFVPVEVTNRIITNKLTANTIPPLKTMIDAFSKNKSGVIMTMGKGGVGKTTIAAAIAIGLAEKGHHVHLTTTDPAAHLTTVLKDTKVTNKISISRIDPKKEVENYRDQVLNKVRETLDEESLKYIEEDLRSPCTEEIAVFQAFANIVDKSKETFVVIDTAPTGHTLLLLDAAHSYHREVTRSSGNIPEAVKNLLPRLRDEKNTNVVLVTLPEATPVFEASRLQEDLRRAQISPKWWVINQSFQASSTTDPILQGRALAEEQWIKKVKDELSKQCVIVPWQADDMIGSESLKKLL